MSKEFLFPNFLCSKWHHNEAVLVNLLRSNSTRMEGYLGRLLGHTYLRGLVFAKFQSLKETTIASTFFVQHHLR